MLKVNGAVKRRLVGFFPTRSSVLDLGLTSKKGTNVQFLKRLKKKGANFKQQKLKIKMTKQLIGRN